jgi:hypothetical protein
VWTPAGPLAQAPGALAVEPAFLDALDAHWAAMPFSLAAAGADAEALTPHRAGVALCGCGCAKPWGAHSSFPLYEGAGWLRGSDAGRYAGSAAYVRRLVATGATGMLLHDPGFELGTRALVLDLGSWSLDAAAVAVCEPAGARRRSARSARAERRRLRSGWPPRAPRGEVVDGDDVDVGAVGFKDRAQDEASDAAKAVDGDFRGHVFRSP